MKIAIFGSSGHASDVADIAIDNSYTEIIFLTTDTGIESFCCFPVEIDTVETVRKLSQKGYHFAFGIGDSKIRHLISERYPDLTYPTLIHSSATIGKCHPANISNIRGTILAAGARITNNVSLGNFCFIGVNAIIGHDCIIEDFVSVMPGAALSGNITVNQHAYIGSNACIRQGTSVQKRIIGQNTAIGMGAAVLKDIPDNHIALGVPAINSKK